MQVIDARNVNYALPLGIAYLENKGIRRESRNGPVLVSRVPVTTVYRRPDERVLFAPERDANPFFHIIEALWMLAGRDDLAVLTPYVARMKDFSDDGGITQPGAYGKRWRDWWVTDGGPRDQLLWAIRRLKNDPNDRRVIIQMYDASFDQDAADNGGKDVPCNIVCAPWVDTDGRLSMTIFCRSNDLVWGAAGANAVHFSVMQEYLAAGIGVPLGVMYQVSNNYHMYMSTAVKVQSFTEDRYNRGQVSSRSMFYDFLDDKQELRLFDEDLTLFFVAPGTVGLRSAFLRQVAAPMALAHRAWRDKKDSQRYRKANEIMAQCRASDWQLAGIEWLKRREDALRKKQEEKE